MELEPELKIFKLFKPKVITAISDDVVKVASQCNAGGLINVTYEKILHNTVKTPTELAALLVESIEKCIATDCANFEKFAESMKVTLPPACKGLLSEMCEGLKFLRDRKIHHLCTEDKMANDKSVVYVPKSFQNGSSLPQVRQATSESSSYSTSGILEAVTLLRHVNLERQQCQSQITALNKELEVLRGKLVAAYDENEMLTLKRQRQSENIESLRCKLDKQVSAFREEVLSCERLKTQTAELEVDRLILRKKVCSITERYEPKIARLKKARTQLQRKIDSYEVEIPKLQIAIIANEEKIKELTRCIRHLQWLITLFLFLLLLIILILGSILVWHFVG